MAKLPDKDTLAKEAAREALNFEIMGRTFREWLEILARYVTEREEEPNKVKTKTPEEKPQRLTVREWRNLDPWETCGQDAHCTKTPFDAGGCRRGCIVPKIYAKLAKIEDEQEATLKGAESEEEE